MSTNGNGRSDPERQKDKEEMIAALPRLKAFAVALSGNETMANDLVQEAVRLALANLHSFQSGTSMQGWLFVILRNHFRSQWRKRKREVGWDDKYEDALSFSTGALGMGAESTYDFNRLLLYVACLSREQADALIAVGYLGITYDEAAERLDCAVGTIKSRVNRARLELRRLMEGSVLQHVDVTLFRSAARGVPKNHPYFPIAAAYEELFSGFNGISNGSGKKNGSTSTVPPPATEEKLWQDLVASGALDESGEDLLEVLQSNPHDL